MRESQSEGIIRATPKKANMKRRTRLCAALKDAFGGSSCTSSEVSYTYAQLSSRLHSQPEKTIRTNSVNQSHSQPSLTIGSLTPRRFNTTSP